VETKAIDRQINRDRRRKREREREREACGSRGERWGEGGGGEMRTERARA